MSRSTEGRSISATRRMSSTLVNAESKVPGIATTPMRMAQTIRTASRWVQAGAAPSVPHYRRSTLMARPGLVIQFKTKPDTAEQFSDILVAALEHVEAEAGTRPWLTLRAEQEPTVFYLVDLFDDEDARNIHLNGAAAELILGTGGALLAEQPSPVPVTLVIGKAV
ncbi:hypothetical protein GKE82_13055 [Conexibacter sp. W3-3-2]|nr:hypothetical protein [Conexibacter sp. W3-3-2]